MQLKTISIVLIWVTLFFHLLTAASWKSVNTNKNIRHSDQSAVMNLAINIKESGKPFITDANRHPLFSWLITPFAGWTKESFAKAKIVTFATFCLSFFLIALFFYKRLSIAGTMWLAAALALPAGLSLFSVTMVTDPLFTSLNGLSIICFALSFKNAKYAFAGGILTGIAFTAKYSGLMALMAYIAFTVIILLMKWFRRNLEIRGLILKSVLAIFGFFLTASPLLFYSYSTHGSPFYNVNSKYYMWTDSWDAAKHFSIISGDRQPINEHRELLKTIPSDSIPSALNYIKQHSAGFIVFRMVGGFKAYFNVLLGGRLKALLLLVSSLFILIAVYYRASTDSIRSRLLSTPSLFILFYLSILLGSVIWYASVSINIRYFYPAWVIASVYAVYLFMFDMPNQSKGLRFVSFTLSFAALFFIFFADYHSLPPSLEVLENSAVNWLK